MKTIPTTAELLADLAKQEIQLWLNGDQLQYRAPKGALTPELRAAILEHKTQLIEFLQQQTVGAAQDDSALPSGQPFPFSDMQEAYWLGQSRFFELGNISAHLYAEFEFVNLDIDRLNHACQKLIERHEMLRMVVLPEGQQQILTHVPAYQVEVVDLRQQPIDTISATLEAVRRRLVDQGPTTDRFPLFEVLAHQLADDRYRIHISLSLLVFDGTSFKILARELVQLYHNPTAILPALEFSYRDYIAKLNALQNTEIYRRSQAYWQNRLPSLPAAPDLPLAKNPATLLYPAFMRRIAKLSPATWTRLKERAIQAGLTPAGVLCAAYAEVLATWSKNDRFIINILFSNRLPIHSQSTDIIGNFSSTNLLAVDRTEQSTFAVRAKRIQEQLWQDFEHSHVSGVQVLRELNRVRGGSSRASAPVVFASNLDARAQASTTDVKFPDPIHSCIQTPQVWLDHSVIDNGGTLMLIWDVVEELFPDGMITDMFKAYQQLLHQLAEDDATWNQTHLPLLPAPQLEQRSLVNATDAPIPPGMLHTLFQEQVKSRSDQVAVISSSRSLTYAQLDRRATQVGHWLRQRGARPNVLIAVVMEKGWEQVVAVLGTLYAGAAYLPVNPSLPPERLWYLLEQSEVGLVLTQSHLNERLAFPATVQRLCVDDDAMLDSLAHAPLAAVQHPEDLAYVIFTSGSTGLPKGVMIDHRGAVNTIGDLNDRFQLTPNDRVLALSSLSFDLSVYDIFGTLAAGATIVMPDALPTPDPAHWLNWLITEQVTIWNSVPALMQMLVEYAASRPEPPALNLRLVMLSGDWIPVTLPEQIGSIAPQAAVVGLGGATEASIWSILYPITTVDPTWKSIPYGRPMLNQTFQVLNAHLEPCPVWVPGELYIGGIGLAKGYWRDDEKTKARFITHPRTGERLYRTGDLGRYLPDGNLEFLGREDFQVKVQGYRIELGEIEAALEQHPAVKSAVVNAVGNRYGDKRLLAYVIPHQILDRIPLQVFCSAECHGLTASLKTEDISTDGIGLQGMPESWECHQFIHLQITLPGIAEEMQLDGTIVWRQEERGRVQFHLTPGQEALLTRSLQHLLATEGILEQMQRQLAPSLREFLQQKLPDYMVPSNVVVLSALPLTPNGKVDRTAFPTVEHLTLERDQKTIAPRTPLELQLTQIWEDLLDVTPISIGDNFFELGGHSLLAVRLVAQVQKQLGFTLSLSTLLQAPTIEQLAAVLNQQASAHTPSPLVKIREQGDQRPFFCVHPVGGNVLCYVDLARLLKGDRPFYGLQSTTDDAGQPFRRIEDMAAHYIRAMQTVQPHGPYLLGGWSMGGVIAFEMARQLQRQGETIDRLILMDSRIPTGSVTYDDAALLLWFINDLGGRFGKRLDVSPDRLRTLDAEQQLALSLDLAKQADIVADAIELPQFFLLFQVFKANAQALADYRPQAYAGRVTVFQPTEADSTTHERPVDAWSEFVTEPIETHVIAGNHYTMLIAPSLQDLADRLQQCLDCV